MVDVILLISGSSLRMGKEKAILSFTKDKNFVSNILDNYLRLPDCRIYVIVNTENEVQIKQTCKKYQNKIKYITNSNPEKGRIWSILTGLENIKIGRGVFIQNIDNPFVDTELLNGMLSNYKSDSYIVPQFNGKNGHPLLLGADLVQELKEKRSRIADLKSFLSKQKKNCFISQNQKILANINCPEDYLKWFPNLV